MKFTIDRSRWLRGRDADVGEGSRLYRTSDKKMCCMGFYLRRCGMSVTDIQEKSLPRLVETDLPPSAGWIVGHAENDLAIVNDIRRHKHRERAIKTIFKRHGVDVTFKGGKTK